MPAARDDYLLRMIQQVAAALRRLRTRVDDGAPADDITRESRAAIGQLLGSQQLLFERLDAHSASALLGDPERVRLWSELLRLDAESLERAGLAVRALPLRGRADALRATLPADAGTGNAAAASDVT